MPTHGVSTLLAVDLAQSVLQRFNQVGQRSSAYSAYGDTPAPAMAPLGFNGQRREPKSGLYLLGNGNRAYSTRLRRFCAPDRLSPFDELNAYAYCDGDPINLSDPTGAFPFALLATGFKALFGIGALASLAGPVVMVVGSDNQTMVVVGLSLLIAGLVTATASVKGFGWAAKRAGRAAPAVPGVSLSYINSLAEKGLIATIEPPLHASVVRDSGIYTSIPVR